MIISTASKMLPAPTKKVCCIPAASWLGDKRSTARVETIGPAEMPIQSMDSTAPNMLVRCFGDKSVVMSATVAKVRAKKQYRPPDSPLRAAR